MAPTTVKTLTYLQQEKTLESSFVRDEDERPKVAYNHFSTEVPVISLAGLDEVHGRRVQICQKIVEACENWGIFQVVDHGVDAKLISDMTRLARDFFALPPEEKLRFDMSGGKKGGFIVSSHLPGEAVKDWREIVTYFSYPVRERDYSRWPDVPEGWKAVTEEYSEKLMGLACKLLEVLSEAMGLEKDALTKACVDMDQKVVVNYYPKCPQPDLTLGLKRHTDPGTITLLLQDQVGGLQATRDNGKTWITVQPVQGAFVVNLGDHGHKRWESLLHQGRRIIVVGDLNIAPFAIDRCDAGPDFENNEFRIWFKSMLIENGGQFSDVFRAKHPDRREAYTCWSQNTGAEVFNFGSRIDHILFSGSCLHESDDLQCHGFIRCHVKDCDILTQYKRCKPESTLSAHRWKGGHSIKLEGSDHAPVFMRLHEIPEVSLHNTPSLSARYVPMVHGVQQTLVSVLMKRRVFEQTKSCEMAKEDIAMGSTCEREELVNKAGSSATCSNECHFPPSQDCNGSILKPSRVSEGSSQEADSKSASEFEKSIIRQCNKSNKKARNSRWSQLSLRSFFQKKTDVDNGVNDSCINYSNNQEEPSQSSPHLHETPTVFDHPSSPKQYELDDDACDQDLAGLNCSSTQEEKSNVASLEWQRIQQLMQNSIPVCKGHKEPCIARVVKKQGSNFGRRFYVCARAEGPASNPEANCGYFKWAASKSRKK